MINSLIEKKMKRTLIAILGCWIALTLSTTAEDSHVAKIETLKQSFLEKASAVLTTADKIDLGLQRYGWKSKETVGARLVVTNMLKATAWRDLPSRDTQRHKDAFAALNTFLDQANQRLEAGQRELEVFKEAEYQAWAKAHPKEAVAIENQKRLEAEGLNQDQITRFTSEIGGVFIKKTIPGHAIIVDNYMPTVRGADGTIDKKATRKAIRERIHINKLMGVDAIRQDLERETAENQGSLSDHQLEDFSRRHGIPISDGKTSFSPPGPATFTFP